MILKINVSQNIQVLVDTKRLIYLEVVAIFIVQNIVIKIKNLLLEAIASANVNCS